jgi:hypothetical protein
VGVQVGEVVGQIVYPFPIKVKLSDGLGTKLTFEVLEEGDLFVFLCDRRCRMER